MSDQRDSDSRLDEMIRKTLVAGLNNSGEGCPDPDLLAAFTEDTLAPTERAKWNTHVSGCAICQRQLAALFFFSSRRRHTSSLRDWSSDVCSSDLAAFQGCRASPGRTGALRR